MAFNLSGTLVTQIGTDTTLVGAANSGALSAAGGGITTVVYGNRTYVVIPNNLTLSITGTLTHDTERECIVFQRLLTTAGQAPTLLIATGATYNFGAPKVAGSTTVFSDSVGWIFSQIAGTTPPNVPAGQNPVIWFNGGFGANSTSLNGVHVAVQGTLTYNGGRAQGRFNFTFRPGSVVNNTVNAKWLVENQGQTPGQEFLTRIYGGTFNTTNLAYEGGSISLGVGLAPATLTFNRTASGVGYWDQGDGTFNGTTQTYNTIRNVTFDGNLVDVALRENGTTLAQSRGIRVQNCGNGSNVNVNGGEVTNNEFNAGYCWITREIDTNITSATGDDIQGRLFIRDTDNGNRTPISPHAFATDTADFTYTVVVDGNISTFTAAGGFAAGTLVTGSGDNEIVLGINNVQRTGTARVRAAANTGVWVIDSRSDDGVLGTDVFTGHFWSYENQYIAFNNDLAGTGTHTYQAFGVPDEQITRPRTGTNNIVTYNTTIGNNLSYNATNVDVNVSMDASDIYDVIKYRKETVTADIESPSASAMHLVRTSGTNNYGNRILNLVSTATLTGNHSNISTLDVNSGTLGEGTYSANTLTQVSNTTDATITVLGAAATALVPAAGATHTRLSLTNTTGVFNILGAGIFTGGSFNSISLSGAGPITCTDTVFTGTDIGVTGNKTLTNTSGTPVLLNSAGLTLTGNEWTSGSSISLTTGILDLDGGSYTTALTGTITTAQTWEWNNLTANSIDFNISTLTGGGIITIETNNVTSRTEAQRWVATLTTLQQSRFEVEAPPLTETFTIPTSTGGTYAVRQIRGGVETQHTAPTAFVSGGTVTFTLSDGGSTPFVSGTDSIRVYLKYDSDISSNPNVVYVPTTQAITFGSGGAISEPAVVGYPARNAITPNANEQLVSINSGAITLTNGTDDTPITIPSARGAGAATVLANTLPFFTAWYNDNQGGAVTNTGIVYQDNNAIQWDDTFTFQSGNETSSSLEPTAGGTNIAVNTFTVHTINGYSTAGTTALQSLSRAGAAEVVGLADVSAALSTVQEAAGGGLDSSNVAGQVAEIANGVGWIVTGNASRIPVRTAYNDAQDPPYSNNL